MSTDYRDTSCARETLYTDAVGILVAKRLFEKRMSVGYAGQDA